MSHTTGKATDRVLDRPLGRTPFGVVWATRLPDRAYMPRFRRRSIYSFRGRTGKVDEHGHAVPYSGRAESLGVGMSAQGVLFNVDHYVDHGALFALYADDVEVGERRWVVVRAGLQERVERRDWGGGALSWYLLGRVELEAAGWVATSILDGGRDRNHGVFAKVEDARRAVERGAER